MSPMKLFQVAKITIPKALGFKDADEMVLKTNLVIRTPRVKKTELEAIVHGMCSVSSLPCIGHASPSLTILLFPLCLPFLFLIAS